MHKQKKGLKDAQCKVSLDGDKNACSVCKSSWPSEYIKMYHVPRDSYRRNLWTRLCRTELNDTSRICEKHFRNADFKIHEQRRSLRGDAMPSLLLPQLQLQQPQQQRQQNNPHQRKTIGIAAETHTGYQRVFKASQKKVQTPQPLTTITATISKTKEDDSDIDDIFTEYLEEAFESEEETPKLKHLQKTVQKNVSRHLEDLNNDPDMESSTEYLLDALQNEEFQVEETQISRSQTKNRTNCLMQAVRKVEVKLHNVNKITVARGASRPAPSKDSIRKEEDNALKKQTTVTNHATDKPEQPKRCTQETYTKYKFEPVRKDDNTSVNRNKRHKTNVVSSSRRAAPKGIEFDDSSNNEYIAKTFCTDEFEFQKRKHMKKRKRAHDRDSQSDSSDGHSFVAARNAEIDAELLRKGINVNAVRHIREPDIKNEPLSDDDHGEVSTDCGFEAVLLPEEIEYDMEMECACVHRRRHNIVDCGTQTDAVPLQAKSTLDMENDLVVENKLLRKKLAFLQEDNTQLRMQLASDNVPKKITLLLKKPFDTNHEFKKFEKLLTADEELQEQLADYFTKKLLEPPEKSINHIWKRTLTDIAAENFVWRGRAKIVKEALRDYTFSQILRATFSDMHPDYPSYSFEWLCTKFFNAAHDRRRKSMRYRKSTTPITPSGSNNV